MTVLSPAKSKAAIAGFPDTGRYSYVAMLLDYAEWGVDLPIVRKRISSLSSGEDFAELFGDIIVTSKTKSRWVRHPNARSILLAQCEVMVTAWDTTLSTSPDRNRLTLEYLADALKRFEAKAQIA